MHGRPQKLVLVDSHSLIFQVYHAIRNPMSSPDGRPTNAVYGFTGDVFAIRDELKPDYLVFAFDRSGPTFRSAIDPEYKAHRDPPPDDLIIQFPMIERVVEAFNIPVIALDEFEADDILATLAVAGRNQGMEVVLCTTDKDCRQLLGEQVRMLNLRKKTYLDPVGLKEDWGIGPEQVIDYQALVGDSVDNVPGVPGIGAKTASKLLQQFGSVDNLLQRIDEVAPEKTKKAIKDNLDKLMMSKKLVALRTDVPLAVKWDDWKLRDFDGPKLLALFQEFGFRGYANRVRGTTAPASSPAEVQAELFPSQNDTVPETFGSQPWVAEYTLIDSADQLASLTSELKQQTRIAVDLETTGLDPLQAAIVGIAITWKQGRGYYIAVRGPAECKLITDEVAIRALKPILEDRSIQKINQNIKYDQLVLRANGVHLAGVVGDSMIADYLLRAGERSHNLDDLARRLLGHENIHIEDLIGKKGKKQITMDHVPTEKVAQYAGEDVDVAWRLTELLEKELENDKLKKLYDDVEIPLIDVLADMEFTGIRLDVPYLHNLSKEMEQQLAAFEEAIYKIAGREFNINSPIQLRKILFDELQLPVQRKTAKSAASSTDQETLELLAPLHPLPHKIVEYRQVAKLKGTYVDALPGLVNPKTGRIHTSFNQAVAATGRLSSADPNLQNIPARTEQGRQIRRAFLPKEGWELLTADYSQIELRLLAHCSGDKNLRQAFVEGKDIHAMVAAKIFGLAENQVSKDQRQSAKAINFGVIYGMSPHGLAMRQNIDRESATKFIDEYFARFPAVQEYQARLLANCAKTGQATTLMGRRRKIVGVRPRTTYKGLNQPEREAVNMEIQGSAADMIKLAMLNVQKRLRAEKLESKMLLTVHDELVFETPPAERAKLAQLVREEMIAALPLDVPVEVDVAVGPNWLDVEDMHTGAGT